MSNVSMLNLNNPTLKKGRSKFNLTHTSHVDFNPGYLIPLDTPIEVMPGDTFKVSQRTIVRMSNPPKVPVMDTLVMDVNYYYVPYRIVWDNWDKFITADNGTTWNEDLAQIVPQVYLDLGNVTGVVYNSGLPGQYTRASLRLGGVLDYLGVPTIVKPVSTGSDTQYYNVNIRAFELRGYYKIWNRFFRYEPLMDEVLIDTSDSFITLDETKPYTSGPKSNKLCPTSRLAGYFTRCLPQPQRGADVLMDLSIPEDYEYRFLNPVQSILYFNSGSTLNGGDSPITLTNYIKDIRGPLSPDDYVANKDVIYELPGGRSFNLLGFSNLQGGTINALREAFAIQRLKDVDARYGSRIGEFTIGHYGVNVPDYRISEPEELAHKRFDININQVVQTSETSASSPQGTTGAYSVTNHYDHYFTKSFVEWGLIYCVGTIRVKNHSYSQGFAHQFNQVDRFSYYFPELANISDMPVYQNEIMPDTSSPENWNDVFGYQEAWAWYKYLPSRVAHHMRPQVANTLAIWTYTDLYSSAPTLSAGWEAEPQANIDRTMYLTGSGTVSQFICDMCFFIEAYRVLPYHSIPGGLTHEF